MLRIVVQIRLFQSSEPVDGGIRSTLSEPAGSTFAVGGKMCRSQSVKQNMNNVLESRSGRVRFYMNGDAIEGPLRSRSHSADRLIGVS